MINEAGKRFGFGTSLELEMREFLKLAIHNPVELFFANALNGAINEPGVIEKRLEGENAKLSNVTAYDGRRHNRINLGKYKAMNSNNIIKRMSHGLCLKATVITAILICIGISIVMIALSVTKHL